MQSFHCERGGQPKPFQASNGQVQLDIWKKTDITQLNVEDMNKKVCRVSCCLEHGSLVKFQVLEYSKTAYQLTRKP